MDLTAVKDFFERVQTQAFAENIQAVSYTHLDVYKRQPQREKMKNNFQFESILKMPKVTTKHSPNWGTV